MSLRAQLWLIFLAPVALLGGLYAFGLSLPVPTLGRGYVVRLELPPAGEPADLLCVPVFEGEAPFSAAFPGFSGILDQAGRFPKDPGKKGSIRVVPVRDASVKALLLAGLGAAGVTELCGLDHLDRGHEAMVARLLACGAAVERR